MLTRRKVFPVLSLLLFAACAREPAAPPAPQPVTVSTGVEIRTIVRSKPTPLATHVVEIDLAKAPGVLKVVAENGEGGLVAATVSRLARRNGLLVAVNGSFFRVPGEKYPNEGERIKAVGGLILDGKTISPRGPGLGLINAGLCIEGRNVHVEEGFECRGAMYGLASGPLLLWQGQPVNTEFADAVFKSPRHPRTAVGVDSEKKRVWLLVADGRQEGVSEGATLDELKEMLRALGAVDALNLDGGGSSTFVARLPGVGLRVLNVPIHDRVPGLERPVATALGMTSRGP
ncbi:MAG: phosphodiester glycosidase family protein [Thermoanaerobaculia bacterium]